MWELDYRLINERAQLRFRGDLLEIVGGRDGEIFRFLLEVEFFQLFLKKELIRG